MLVIVWSNASFIPWISNSRKVGVKLCDGSLALVSTDGIGAAMRESGWGLITHSPQWPPRPGFWMLCKCPYEINHFMQLFWGTALKIKGVQGSSPAPLFPEGKHFFSFSSLLRACIDLGYLWNYLASWNNDCLSYLWPERPQTNHPVRSKV